MARGCLNEVQLLSDGSLSMRYRYSTVHHISGTVDKEGEGGGNGVERKERREEQGSTPFGGREPRSNERDSTGFVLSFDSTRTSSRERTCAEESTD